MPKQKIRVVIKVDLEEYTERIKGIISAIVKGKREINTNLFVDFDVKSNDVPLINIVNIDVQEGEMIKDLSNPVYFYEKNLKIEDLKEVGVTYPVPLGLFCIDKFDEKNCEFSEIARFEAVIKTGLRRIIYEEIMEKEIYKPLNWKVEMDEGFMKKSNSHVSLLSDPSMREVILHSNRITDKIRPESDKMLNLLKELVKKDVFKSLRIVRGADAVDDIKSFLEAVGQFNDRIIREKDILRIPTILIEGSTGTGKSLMARYLGDRILRDEFENHFSKLSLVNLNKDTLDTELFGCIPGTFTGSNLQPGKIISNYGGVLFLDEIGDAPLEVQTKLLTYIDDMNIPMTGYSETTPIKVPLVLIAATNRNLLKDIDKGVFREDLYHRFTYKIKLPDLKDRKDDFRFLLSFALQKAAGMEASENMKISIKAIEYLEGYDFPGNFRELESRCAKAIANAEIAGRTVILKEDFEGY